MNNSKNYGLGIILIIVGVYLGLKSFNLITFNIFFPGWWTLFIIIPCLLGLFNDKDYESDLIGLIIGILLLLASLDLISFKVIFKLLVPVSIVILGLSIIYKELKFNKYDNEIKKIDNKNKKDIIAIFSEQKVDLQESPNYINMNSIFGSIKLDLRNSKLDNEIVINAYSIFGEITINVPNDYKVITKSIPIFGSTEDKRKNKVNDTKKIIYLNSYTLFGGVVTK